MHHTILLVDDDPFVLFGLKKELQSEGYHILTADTGKDAIDIMKIFRIDLVITDLIMNPVNGIEVLTKAREFHKKIKVMIMTGYNNTTSLNFNMTLADDIITKPCDTEEFNTRIKACLNTGVPPETEKHKTELLQSHGGMNYLPTYGL